MFPMNEKEIRAVVSNFVNRLRKKGGFKQEGNFIVLNEQDGQYTLLLSADKKAGVYSIPFPDDLSEKPATATCELSGILYYTLKNRQRNLKVAQATSEDTRTRRSQLGAASRWNLDQKRQKQD